MGKKEEDKKELTKSLKKFNLEEISAINTDNTILRDTSVAVLLALGRSEEGIDVRVPNHKLTKEELDEYLLRSNRNVGERGFGKLKEFKFDFLNRYRIQDVSLYKTFLHRCGEDWGKVLFDGEKEYKILKNRRLKKGIYMF
jgi:site-specific DNA-methyltransferase (adenine-specific)